MIEVIILSIGIGLLLSVDAFVACTVYASNGQYPKKSKIWTPIFIGVLHFLLPVIAYLFCSIFRNSVNKYGNLIGGVIFILLGLMSLIKKDDDSKGIVGIIGVILLSFGVSIDSIFIGFSYGFTNKLIIIPAIIFGIISATITFIAFILGNKISKSSFNTGLLTFIIFVSLGILTIFGII